MSARISIAILWLIWARLKTDVNAASSGERVHIRLHMPEVVRQHTHFHKVYKHLPPAPVPPPPQLPPLQQIVPLAAVGKPHISLLGYTTTASGSGIMAPNPMQLMATAPATPMQQPNFGPALFDNYNQQQEEKAAAAAAAAAAALVTPSPATVKPSLSNYFAAAAAPATKRQQQLLQQLLGPNLMTAITAAKQQEMQTEMEPELELEPETEMEPEPELEHNELLNGNFLAALQREYLSKFGHKTKRKKRKRVNYATQMRNKAQQLLQQQLQQLQPNSEEHYDDYQEQAAGTGYAEDQPQDEDEQQPYLDAAKSWQEQEEEAAGFDSASAFSGQQNALSYMPSVDQFLGDMNGGGNTYGGYYDNMHNEYGHTGNAVHTVHTGWQATPTQATPTRLRTRPRRPNEMGSTGKSNGNGNVGKLRYVKLTTRRKRKNRIKAKRYRI